MSQSKIFGTQKHNQHWPRQLKDAKIEYEGSL